MAATYDKPQYYANAPGDVVEYYNDSQYPDQFENPEQPSGSQSRHKKKKKHRSGDPDDPEAAERRRSRRHRKSRGDDEPGDEPIGDPDNNEGSREHKKKKKRHRRPRDNADDGAPISPDVIGDVVATEYTFDDDGDYGDDNLPNLPPPPTGHFSPDEEVDPTYAQVGRGHDDNEGDEDQWHDDLYHPESPDHHIGGDDHIQPPESQPDVDTGKKKKPSSGGGFSKLLASFRSKKKKPENRPEQWESNPQLFMPNVDSRGGTLEPAAQNVDTNNRSSARKGFKSVSSNEACIVLLDGDRLTFNIDKKATGSVLLQKVCSELNIYETDYFGLTWTSKKIQTWFWLDMEKKLVKQLKHGEPWLFHFQVKFYPPEPSLIQEDITRYQLCLQLRHDVYTGKLPCSWVTHALLGSYMVQSEMGDYVAETYDSQGLNYVREFEFFHVQNDDLLAKIVELHKTHVGMSPDQADLKYLETAKRLEHYGVDLHPAWDSDDVQIYVGISFYGVFVYKDRLRLSRFAWPKILRISYKKNFFYLKIRSDVHENVEGIIGFRLQTHHLAKRLWKNAIEHHTFFRLKETKYASKTGTKIFPGITVGSKYRFSGRTLYQHRTNSIDRPHPQFDRTLTKRRTASMPFGLDQSGFQYSSMHSLHRAHPRDMTIGKTQSVEYLGPRRAGSSTIPINEVGSPRGGLYTRTNQEPFSSPMPQRNRTNQDGSVSGSVVSGDSQTYAQPQPQYKRGANAGVLSPQAPSQRSGGSSRPRPNASNPPASRGYYHEEDATYANMPAPPEDLRYQEDYEDEML